MDDEGRRLAGLSDEQWAAHVANLAREAAAGPSRPGPGRKRPGVRAAAVAVVAIALIGIGYLALGHRQNHDAGPAPSSAAPVAPAGPFGDSPAAKWAAASLALKMPAPIQEGPYSPSEVAAALARARTFLLTARTDPGVLTRHDVSRLKQLVAPFALRPAHTRGQPIQSVLDATFLGPGNTLADPVRLTGSVSMAYRAQNAQAGERLTVTANLVWAYALKASYPVASVPFRVVAIHEKTELDFYLDTTMDGPDARPVPYQDDSLWFGIDCGYFNQRLLALPRTNDPDALPDRPGADPSAAFDPNGPVTTAAHQCRH